MFGLDHRSESSRKPEVRKDQGTLQKISADEEHAAPTMKDRGLDSCGKRVERLKTGGIPEWLGQDPAAAAKK